MKWLSVKTLPEEDTLLFTFEGAFDRESALERELEPFLQTLEECAGGWMPDVVKGRWNRKYSRAAIWKGLEEERREKRTSVGLYRTQLPALDATLRLWLPPLPPELRLWLEVYPLTVFEEMERCQKFIDMVRTWARRYPVTTYLSAHSAADRELAGSPNFGRDDRTTLRDGFDKVYEVSWLNVFSPKLVEAVGRERMLSTPAHRLEELPNGAVLLVTWPTAADFARDEARVAQARAFAHLRPDLDFDTVLRSLRERSAALVPVEPRFHPDVAPLLSRVVDLSSIGSRQRRIAELNAYEPPEPEEWIPASEALPPDVESSERVLEYYGTLSEHLVALMHTHVPSVFKETPESLTDVDYRFYFENFPQVFERERIDEYAVPAVGAYLGEVLVRNLGGKWIPRKRLGEAQVLVGDRVWLPMVRAHRYLRSTQSLLDFSLTQLYRAAERHSA
ncbi:hypothetical protein P2318_30135 [Myxococcaceae bacterium GXIMD 01537]